VIALDKRTGEPIWKCPMADTATYVGAVIVSVAAALLARCRNSVVSEEKMPIRQNSCPLTRADGHPLMNSFAPWRIVMLKLDPRTGSSRPRLV
jgi:hypothetical protein